MATVFCTYSNDVGWRALRSVKSTDAKIEVMPFGDAKLLRIPSAKTIARGMFCSPARLATTYVRFQGEKPMAIREAAVEGMVLLRENGMTNYRQLGMNTRLVCGDDRELAEAILSDAEVQRKTDRDSFWDGYDNEITRLVNCIDSIIQGVTL